MLYIKARKLQNMSFPQKKTIQNVMFWMQTFFLYVTWRKLLTSESNALFLFQSEIWNVVKLLKKSDALFERYFKHRRFRKF